MHATGLCPSGSSPKPEPGTSSISELPAFEEIPHGVLGAAEHDPSVSVAEGQKTRPRGDAGLCEQAEGKLDPSAVVDTEFCWFTKHGTSVALSPL